jgi:hypothetical protein
MDEATMTLIVSWIVASISGLYAWWQNKQKIAVVEFYTTPITVPQAVTDASVLNVPEKSYKMAEWTKKWICAGESEDDKLSLMQQVTQAELQGLTGYTIRYSKGYYEIAWGLIKSSGRDK